MSGSSPQKMKQSGMQHEVYVSIDNILKGASPSNLQNHKIFKGRHKKEDEKFYEPSIISIGPYYHGVKNLKAMEGHKVPFLKKLLERQKKGLGPYVEMMTSNLVKARDYYFDLPPKWQNDKDFSEMMLLDGCFIVELIHQLREKKLDATVSKGGRLISILHDLALVENQLPFFVLWELLGISVAEDTEKYECIQLLLSTFKRKMPGVKPFDENYGELTNVKHLVDLLHSLWSRSDHDANANMEVDEEVQKWIWSITEGEAVKWNHINSASELIEAGIQFKKAEFKKAEGSLFDIKFANGKFKMPSMIIEDRTESLYHNIIAHEQHSMLIEENGDDNRYSERVKLTFFCRLMDCLINSENDVQILRKHGIIVNCLGDDGAVAQMFNRLGVHVGHFSEGFFYAHLFNDVNDYYQKHGDKFYTSFQKMEESEMKHEVSISIDSIMKSASPSNLQNHKIFKGLHKKEDEKFYVPSIISIGPYYHGVNHLKAMEGHKVRFLKKLIERRERGRDPYVEMMTSNLVEGARDYYFDLPPKWQNDKVFSEMMLLDGCFIVELIHQLRENKLDATVSKGGRLTCILHDLALVENQLPFFVLWELLGISVAGGKEKYEWIQLLLSTFKRKMPGVKRFDENYGGLTNVKHLVDLLHSLWSDANANMEVDKEVQKWIWSITEGEAVHWNHINSASELIEVGIQFKKAEGSLFDIKFANGKFKIPSMIIEERTESLYHNIIAHEQHSMLIEESGDDNRYSERAKLTFYCRLMDCLINSENDVQILRKRGIIVNCLGDDEAVAQMFNRLGVHVGHFSEGFFYARLFNNVNHYYKRQWNKWRTTLWREHLKTPWACISVAAAVILLVLTALQTQFAIFPLQSKGP